MRVSEMRTGDGRTAEGKETVLKGISGCDGTVAVGRVCILGIGQLPLADCATILCLFEMPCERELDSVIDRISPAGMILAASAISPRLLELIIYRRIPYIIVKNSFSREYSGRVAMLDTQRDIVVIDPELETIGAYSRRGLPAELPVRRPTQTRRDGLLFEEGGRGVFADVLRLSEEGDVYSRLMEIVESFCGVHVAVSISVPENDRERETFKNSVEGIYRAAVYGSFSMYLRGYDSERRLRSAFADMHRVFCRLEEEGREFNGYLRRGIVIESPVWLLRPSPFIRADAVCYDIDRLTACLTGCEVSELPTRELEKNAIMRIWEQYFSRFATQCKRIAVAENTSGELLEAWRALSGAEEIYGLGVECKEENA